ncbi:TetR/AcrR family transcriptional regulator [Nocardia miyunensis]|uniref:TetR/AcrR family transcriptional regulator n=1 Tax=Nocardia miyunensis TaxID=282684 RepID=UPI00082B1038|nr:TetR/AcrR family transcriptional regulator [Nocardia miyunensis]
MDSGDRDSGSVMRADGRRNRDQLMRAAQEVFAVQGTGASLREVARTAGVNVATLYRHFPTRDALLGALLGDGFDQLATRAQELAAKSDAAEGLWIWTRTLVDALSWYDGLPDSVSEALRDPNSPLHDRCERLRVAAAELLHRAQQSGQVRSDLGIDELLATSSAVARLARPAADPAAASERFLTLFIEGLTTA